MELEGFGASLVGHVSWVIVENERDVWLPWEFLTGTSYQGRIFISGGGTGTRLLEAENTWSAHFSPASSRDWSLVATYTKACSAGGAVFLTLDVGAARQAPAAFFTFLDGLVAEGRVLTRVYFCSHDHLLGGLPDAVFFPPLAAHGALGARGVLARLPSRASSGVWHPPPPGEWDTLVSATAASGLGIVATHVGESEWRLFWHKPADSMPENTVQTTRRASAWIQSAGIMLDRCC